MQVMKVSKGDYVARRQNKVMEWLLIQEGSVVEKFGFAEIVLQKNAMIGLLESEWFFCDYIAREDTTLIRFPCTNSEDLQKILEENEKYRLLFLHTAIEQRQQALVLYQQLLKKCHVLFNFAGEAYENYKQICEELFVQEQSFPRMESLRALEMKHKVDDWEVRNSESLVKGHFREYLQLMMKDDAMCVGAIMEAAAQVRRATLGIGEMVNYLQYNKDILLAESKDDLFHLFFDTAVSLAKNKRDITPYREGMKKLMDVMGKLGVYTESQLETCREACEQYDFESVSSGRVNVVKEDCVAYILEYAGCENEYMKEFKQMLQTYKDGRNSGSRDSEANGARKWLGEQFFHVYRDVFLRVMREQQKPEPILAMFLNFGFMDVDMLGEEYTTELLNLIDQLGLFAGEHVFTMYEWLKSIYEGKREPSKNEFDVDYQEEILQKKKRNEITEEEWLALKVDVEKKVEYEILNMFHSGQRMTYGQITTFMPILQSQDLLQSLKKMAITNERVEEALNRVRKIDYTALYREITFSDPEKGIPNERIRKEVIPDVILFPTAGSRAVMWQEIEGVKRDSSARFLFPIFSIMDLEDQMIEQIGNYRWEMCRRVQGPFWNDVRDLSLTSEYYDYLQFYRKNSELSPEAKEKVKASISKARNSYREVFVRDYIAWIKYESRGGSRLNKVARRIMGNYCPFCKEIRDVLKNNPVYETAFRKLELQNAKREHYLTKLFKDYQNAGGVITAELEGELNLCKM